MPKNIEPSLKYIKDYLTIKDNEIFIIPEYQRGYSWQKEQCDKLYQDIESFMDSVSNNSKEPYFFGTIIIDCSNDNKFSLIDGQQRTTTFLLLLKAICFRIKEVLKNFSTTEKTQSLEEGLKAEYNTILEILFKTNAMGRVEILNNYNKAKEIFFIENHSINEEFKNELATILQADTYNTAEQQCFKISNKQSDNKYSFFFRNFKFFYQKLETKQIDYLYNFTDVFLNHCQIIEIRSWQTEQAITMFNSLNSTGMPLTDADIISAQLYSNASDKQKFSEVWETINKTAIKLSQKKIVDISSILQQFMYIKRARDREYINEKTNVADVATPGLRTYYMINNKELLTNPFDLCNNVKKLVNIWDKIQEYPVVRLLLKFNENIKIYFISYLNRYNIEDISEEIVSLIAKCLIRFFTILELVDTGFSNKQFKTFLFGENVKLVDNQYSFIDIENDFNSHIQQNWKQEELKTMLTEYDKNILVFLNEFLYAERNKLKFTFNNSVNVEHIMPQSGINIATIMKDAKIEDKNEFKAVVNKLGNKLLLEESINKSISNEWFKTKKTTSVKNKTGYKDSKYYIAQNMVKFPKDIWTVNDIEERTEKIADEIVNFIFTGKI